MPEKPAQKQLEYSEMTAWEQFFDHPTVKENNNLAQHGHNISKRGVPFSEFRRVLANKDQLAKMSGELPASVAAAAADSSGKTKKK